MYWCQPLYWPAGGASKRLIRPSRPLHREAPSRSQSPASVMPFHAASRTTAPGLSMLPSRLASTRDPPAAYHASSIATSCVPAGLGEEPLANTAFNVGQSWVIRTSSVAPALAAARTLASVAFG